MAYRLDFTDEAKGDLRHVKSSRARSLIEGALEREGPCIGERLRGSGSTRFCRLAVPEHAKNTWRIVYEWPTGPKEAPDLIWIWAVREETEQPETDV